MMNNFKQFVPSEVCLSCDGCCRFKEEDSAWRPKVTEPDIAGAQSQGLAEKVLKATSQDRRLKTRCHQDEHLCSFFDPVDHTCGIYPARPFECRLYPFILHKRGGETVLSVHTLCPHIQQTRSTQQYMDYLDYLRAFFGQAVVKAAVRADSSINDYSAYKDELEDVFIFH